MPKPGTRGSGLPALHIGFTGSSRGITLTQWNVLAEKMKAYTGGKVHWHHGDCVGADDVSDLIARQLEFAVVLHPPIAEHSRAFCDQRGSTTVRPARDFLVRNHDIVDASERMFACPAGRQEQLRSGTWATIRYTWKVGKPLTIIYPDGDVEEWLHRRIECSQLSV